VGCQAPRDEGLKRWAMVVRQALVRGERMCRSRIHNSTVPTTRYII